ncbi:unnamed protein product [Blepharisma stoltei]|uniref:FCP1 homology domain-containing protein n=1 Tax=Blepharisma stoltei TaxID=1481888 RepID=A0AAU9JGS9_9CILI|nr:unnamed protein product [Blepharisma stoltei]
MENFKSRRNSHSLNNLLSNRSQERPPKFARMNKANETLRDWKSSRAPLLNHKYDVKKKAKNGTASMLDILEQEEKSEYSDQIVSSENASEMNLANDKSFLPSITLCGFYKPQQYPLHTISRPAVFSSKLEIHEKQNNRVDNSEKYAIIQQNNKNNETELEEIIRKRITLPPNKFSKTVILDLDETLVHCSKYIDKNDIVIKLKLPDFPTGRFGVKIRPHTSEFLQEISQFFEVIIFTASTALYADPILDLLDPEHKFFTQRFYRESCIHKGHLKVKDLRIFSNRNLKDLIIIDNSWNSISNQKSNGILITSWYGDSSDHELQDVLSFLKYLCSVKDVRESIKLAPKAFSKHKASKSYNSL